MYIIIRIKILIFIYIIIHTIIYIIVHTIKRKNERIKLYKQGAVDEEIAKVIKIYDFLSICDNSDPHRIIDSGAFNDIIKDYLILTVKRAG